MEEMMKVVVLSLSLEVEDDFLENAVETLTPKRVFIGFPIRLMWLEPTKGLGHLV